MGKFKTELHVHPHPTKNHYWVLDKEFIYVDGNTKYVVPKDFITNFASVPRPLWSIFPPYGKYTKATVIHDFLYCLCDANDGTRKDADKLFYQMLLELGVNKYEAYVVYRLIRIFGSRYYKED